MKLNVLILALPAFFAVFLIAGCSGDKEIPAEPERIPLRISTEMRTRASDSGYEKSDVVGIYVVNLEDGTAAELKNSGNHLDNMDFTFDGTEWKAGKEVYWKDETTPADFYCYYPYRNGVTDVSAVPFGIVTDQSTVEKYKSGELLWGRAEGAAPSENPVQIMTNHALSKLVISVLPGKGYDDASLAQESISVTVCGLRTGCSLDLRTGKVTETGSVGEITPLKDGNVWKALVVPQKVTDVELVKLNVGGIPYSLVQTAVFESGMQYSCSIKVNRLGEGVNIGIGEWEDSGIDYGGTVE